MQSTWGVDSVPFLSFMSSSSVVLQLSVDPCDERERQYARWRDGCMKVGRRKKKYRNRFADRVYKPCGTIYGAHTVNQQTHTHKESPASTDIPQHTLTHTHTNPSQEHTKPCTNQPIKHEGKTHSSEWYLWKFGVVVLGSSSNDPCSMAELKEVAYLDAIGWIVHDSGLWFLGEAGESLPCRAEGRGWGDPNSTTSMMWLYDCHDRQ